MNKYLKFVIAALIIAAGVYLMMNRNIGWGIVLVILSAVPILLFFQKRIYFGGFLVHAKTKHGKSFALAVENHQL